MNMLHVIDKFGNRHDFYEESWEKIRRIAFATPWFIKTEFGIVEIDYGMKFPGRVPRKFYYDYINSPAFKIMSDAKKFLVGNKCQSCNLSKQLDCHHCDPTYSNLGNEEFDDLTLS